MQGLLKYSNPVQITEGSRAGQWVRDITEVWRDEHRNSGTVFFNPENAKVVQNGERFTNEGVTFNWTQPYSEDVKGREKLYWGEHDFLSAELTPEAREHYERLREIKRAAGERKE